MTEQEILEIKQEREKMKTRIRVNKHRRAVAEAEGLVRQWAWWIKHNTDVKPRAPRGHEQGHDEDFQPVTTRGRHDPQRLDPRFEAYLVVEKFVIENGGWQGNADFLFKNAKKRYQVVLSMLHANGPRKEWYRCFLLGLASSCRDHELPDVPL